MIPLHSNHQHNRIGIAEVLDGQNSIIIANSARNGKREVEASRNALDKSDKKKFSNAMTTAA